MVMAAQIGMAGLDPMTFLEEKDPDRIMFLQGVAHAAAELRDQEWKNLAVHIANRVGEMLGG